METGHWAIILWGFGQYFLIFPNFLSLKSFGNSEATRIYHFYK